MYIKFFVVGQKDMRQTKHKVEWENIQGQYESDRDIIVIHKL